jgi:hypothetical protein
MIFSSDQVHWFDGILSLPAANKMQKHKTARMAQAQQSPASGVLLGELHVGVRKAVLRRIQTTGC